MIRNRLFGLCAATLFSAAATAQCSDNLYSLHLVDSAGTPAPSHQNEFGVAIFTFPTEEAYVAFDPSLPSGHYYVHMIDADLDGMDEVVSDNDPMDRIVQVTNTGGVITLALPFSSNSDPSLFGVGLNGQGQSLRLHYRQSVFTPCRFGVVMGDWWDLSGGAGNPYMIGGGINPGTGSCAIRSYVGLEVGSGAGSNVHGIVFLDSDRDGVRDPGEEPISG
jgi:hypothetical protein